MRTALLRKTTLFVLSVLLLSVGITFGIDRLGLPEKTEASIANMGQSRGALSSADLMIIEGISNNSMESRELARFIAVDNVTKNPDADQLALLIILLDLFPQDIEELSRLIATERTL